MVLMVPTLLAFRSRPFFIAVAAPPFYLIACDQRSAYKAADKI
jgi:hypothetical protein